MSCSLLQLSCGNIGVDSPATPWQRGSHHRSEEATWHTPRIRPSAMLALGHRGEPRGSARHPHYTRRTGEQLLDLLDARCLDGREHGALDLGHDNEGAGPVAGGLERRHTRGGPGVLLDRTNQGSYERVFLALLCLGDNHDIGCGLLRVTVGLAVGLGLLDLLPLEVKAQLARAALPARERRWALP